MTSENLYQTGINPMTGEKAIRASVYELLQQIVGVEFSPHDIVGLIPSTDASRVADALRGLIHNPAAYPGVHRIGRGRYVYDPSRPQQWMTFPNMARRRRVGKRVMPVAPVKAAKTTKVNPVKAALAGKVVEKAQASIQAEAILAEAQQLGQFVEIMAVFDSSTGKFLPTDSVVLLRDDKGCYWQATKV